MAIDDDDDDGGGGLGAVAIPIEGEDDAPKVKGKRRLIIILIAVLILASIGGGLYFTGMLKKFMPQKPAEKTEVKADEKSEEKPSEKPAAPSEVYVDLDEFLVNLDSQGKQQTFLKMTVTLVVPSADAVKDIQAKMPRIRDSFQVYLRELRVDDLQGSAGLYRLREDLLLRLNKIMYPIKINDILFKSILVQ